VTKFNAALFVTAPYGQLGIIYNVDTGERIGMELCHGSFCADRSQGLAVGRVDNKGLCKTPSNRSSVYLVVFAGGGPDPATSVNIYDDTRGVFITGSLLSTRRAYLR
jgi:hypothetical protein